MALHSRYAVTVSPSVATRSRADCSSMEARRCKSLINVPQHLGDEMAHGRTGGWLLAAETISAGQTTMPPEIIIDITSEELRGHTSLNSCCYLDKLYGLFKKNNRAHFVSEKSMKGLTIIYVSTGILQYCVHVFGVGLRVSQFLL